MAGTNLLVLIDDIASVLDDVALMTKIAAKKTAGVLSDDLVLNAQQVAGVRADRELPVVLAVAKGSIKNKLILVPVALAISFVAPWIITPLLMLGGIFLCFEGIEKLVHRIKHGNKKELDQSENNVAASDGGGKQIKSFEKEKIRGAIRTDFILSAEIIIITLGTVAAASVGSQVIVLIGISLLMTVGVYGVVAGIVKLDDGGLYLSQRNGKNILNKAWRGLGRFVLIAAPKMMKGLSVVGMIAMFLVGGSILTHGIPGAHKVIEEIVHSTISVTGIGRPIGVVLPMVMEGITGFLAGAIVLVLVATVNRHGK